MSRPRTYCVDFDDYCDVVVDRLDLLVALKEKIPPLLVTLYTIPQRTSAASIAAAKALGSWVQLAPHGWRHTRGECLSWTSDEAVDKISLARDMGIDAPIFRAPAWLLDAEVYDACKSLGYAVASHKTFRITDTTVPEYIYNWRGSGVKGVHGHMTQVSGNYIEDMLKDGRLDLPASASFVFPQSIAKEVTGTCA